MSTPDEQPITGGQPDQPSASTSSLPTKAGHSLVEKRRHHLRFHYLIGLVILVLFSVLKVFFGHYTAAGHWLHLQAFHWLHSLGSLTGANGELPSIYLVDISNLKPVKEAGPGPNADLEFTPRTELRRLVEAIAECQPAVIGVDIDLSPETNRFVAPGTFEFFDACLAIAKTNAPVLLGIKRTEALGPENWLGHIKYANLAASIDRPTGLVTRMVFEYEFGPGAKPLKSLSHALAEAYNQHHRKASAIEPRWHSFLTEQVSETVPFKSTPDFVAKEFFVDYHQRGQLERNSIPYEQLFKWRPGAAAQLELAPRLNGKIVLIGDAKAAAATDSAIIPGEPEPVPGIYVHACAAYTLTKAPLFELRTWAGLLLSFALSLLAIRTIHKICWKYSERGEVTAIPLNILLTLLLLGVLVALSAGLMKWTRVMWLEVFAVCLVLVVHCLVEIFIASVNWAQLRKGHVTAAFLEPTRTDAE